MGLLLNLLASRKLLVSDGAWGTLLQARGLAGGECPETWNASRPDDVRAVAAAYAAAGADLVLSNTFGASRPKLEKAGLAGRVAELNAAGARLSLEAVRDPAVRAIPSAAGAAADRSDTGNTRSTRATDRPGGVEEAVVAASIGPTGEFCEPLGVLSVGELEAIFSEQIGAIYAAGVTAVCIETMSAIDEAVAVVRAAKALAPANDVICTFTFARTPAGPRTMMGVTPAQAAIALTDAGADIVGANCGNGMELMIPIAAEMSAATRLPILIHANAGLPELVGDQTLFRETPAQMASRVKDLVHAGARILGGCCGTTPAHIAALRTAVDALR